MTEAFDLRKYEPNPVAAFSASPNFREGDIVAGGVPGLSLVKAFQRHLVIKYSSKRPTPNVECRIEENSRLHVKVRRAREVRDQSNRPAHAHAHDRDPFGS